MTLACFAQQTVKPVHLPQMHYFPLSDIRLIAPAKPEHNASLPRFAVISDTHFGNENGIGSEKRVTQTLRNLTNKTPLDAIFVVGDITDMGQEQEYDMAEAVFGNTANVPAGVKIYYVMGNHDNHAGDVSADRFCKRLHQPLHQYFSLKGYPFITLSMTGSRGESYNEEAQRFLSDKLAEAARDYPDKPIFVFEHIPTINTSYGSAPWGQLVLTPILSRYPQVIVFTGHTHTPVGDPRSIHQDMFTSINDGNVSWCEVEEGEQLTGGTIIERSDEVNEGLIVNVLTDGNVEVERWDTWRNEEILPRWLVEAPHDGSKFTYKHLYPAPQFAADAKPVIHTGDRSCEITFPQATDPGIVVAYQVNVVIADNLNESVASRRIASQYYLNSRMPAHLTVSFTDLPAGKQLCVLITAINADRRMSIPVRSETFGFYE
jgi:predicted phosphodiesterase